MAFPHHLDDDVDLDLVAESREARRSYRHWCSTCLGHTGPGSPCAPDEPEDEPEESTTCTCQLEPTIEEADWGVCMCCGKGYA